ncbi:MAG: hypothetical protein ACRBFS_05165 [Aureispira sp.]
MLFASYAPRLLLLIGWLLFGNCLPIQAAIVSNTPPQKNLKKRKRAFKKRKRWRKQKIEYKITKKSPNTLQEGAPSLGAILGWLLFLYLLWWVLMAIPIMLGVMLGIPALWIIGVVLGLLPIGVLLIIFLVALLAAIGSDRT